MLLLNDQNTLPFLQAEKVLETGTQEIKGEADEPRSLLQLLLFVYSHLAPVVKLSMCSIFHDQTLLINKPLGTWKFQSPTEIWHKKRLWLIEQGNFSKLKGRETLSTPLQSYRTFIMDTTPAFSPPSNSTMRICL